MTIDRFEKEGLPAFVADGAIDTNHDAAEKINPGERYLHVNWGEGVMEYEKHLGFDPVRRIHFVLPFRRLEETSEYKTVVESQEDWDRLKEYALKELEVYFTDEMIENTYGPLKEGHDRGDYSIRFNLEGFFGVPRELMGIESHLFVFYDEPELLHDINDFILEIYQTKLLKVIDILQPDVVYFMAAGVEGFLPMDVNAGMDIIKVREMFPTLKFIGSFNKLMIAEGKEAIDKEFERLLPIIRQGGYIPGSDHQVAPSTSLENYKYYISKLHEVMKQAGAGVK